MIKLKPCPFCGDVPKLPDGGGTQYEIECICGMACSSVQICDYMTIEERIADDFIDYRYGQEFIDRARDKAVEYWNERVESWNGAPT